MAKLERWELESLEMDLIGLRKFGVEHEKGNERLVAELKEVSRNDD